MLINNNSHNEIKHGAFTVFESHAVWNGDPALSIQMTKTSDVAYMEGLWDCCGREIRTSYETAITGMCIWGKHDCVFHFKPNGKGNAGAKRSLSNLKDRDDILARLQKNQQIEKIVISDNPFGLYQVKMVRWQDEVVRRLGIRKLYYSLPINEYINVLNGLEDYLPRHQFVKLKGVLYRHNGVLMEHIVNTLLVDVEFINPMSQSPGISVEESYTWPYHNLDVDIGLEEMEEIRIPYQAMKGGARIPPILLGMLGYLSPYYEQRDHASQVNLSAVETGLRQKELAWEI